MRVNITLSPSFKCNCFRYEAGREILPPLVILALLSYIYHNHKIIYTTLITIIVPLLF
ncbi:MAG: hypothetical protein O7D30_10645 [Rickettsia endosymbiont of Ixodes persulcatus]|nr:hypothetical protein [Rickettsia endosymbiont of Ixodes persulcatus]